MPTSKFLFSSARFKSFVKSGSGAVMSRDGQVLHGGTPQQQHPQFGTGAKLQGYAGIPYGN